MDIRIVFINLDRRPDRCRETEAELARAGFAKHQITRFSALQHPSSPNAGCNMSHAAALRLAHDVLGLEAVLILEDDFSFIPDVALAVRSIRDFLCEQADWDAVLLSPGLPVTEGLDPARPWKRCLRACNAAGYIVHRRQMLELARLIDEAAPLLASTGMHWVYQNDVVWNLCMQQGRWFCFDPPLGYQRLSYSDLSGCVKGLALVSQVDDAGGAPDGGSTDVPGEAAGVDAVGDAVGESGGGVDGAPPEEPRV
jgi:hypothetical protein